MGPLVNNVISEADVDMDHCFMSSVRGRIRLSFVRVALRGSDCFWNVCSHANTVPRPPAFLNGQTEVVHVVYRIASMRRS